MDNSSKFQDLAAALLRDAPRLVRQWLPNGKLEGREWCCGSIKGDKGRSFKVNIDKGTWADFAGNERGGDLISLYKEIHQLSSMGDAYTILSGESLKPDFKTKTAPQQIVSPDDIIEPFPDGQKPPMLSISGFSYYKSWNYRNAEGQIIYVVQRYNNENGEKEIRPFRYMKGKFVSKQLPKPRPIYNLDSITKNKSKAVMVVEGEKAADAAKCFEAYNITTWPMVAKNVQYADWSPLKGHGTVTLVPDADEQGVEAMLWLGRHLIKEQKVIRLNVVDTSSKPQGWDIAEHLDKGGSVAQLGKFVYDNVITFEDFEKRYQSPEMEGATLLNPKELGPHVDERDPIGGDESLDDYLNVASIENDLYRNVYFRFLGFKGEAFFFYVYKTGQIVELGSKQCGEEAMLVMLAPPEFWLEAFQGNYKAARVALVQLSQNIRFNARKVRKLGLWMDSNTPLAHLGEYIMTPDGVTSLKNFKSHEYVYEYSENRVKLPRLSPESDVSASRLLIEMCSGGNWVQPTYGPILAGWMFMSLCCASLRWRSHVYLIGPAGSGKTWMLDNIVDKFFLGFKFKAASSSTEAAIRQSLDNNIVPVIMDEAEAEDNNSAMRRKAIFELARFASAATPETPITKGSSNQSVSAREFYIRSPFLFASINTSMDYADESRTTFLKLAPIPNDVETRKKFKSHEMLVRRTMNEDYTCGMLRRAVRFLPQILTTYEIMVDVILMEMAKDAREAEQMSYYMTGLWYLENDHEPSVDEAVSYVEKFRAVSENRRTMLSSEEKLVSMISQIKIDCDMRGRVVKRTVGELAMLAQMYNKGDDLDKDYENAHLALMRAGLKVDNARQPYRFYIFNESTIVRSGLYGSSFYPSWDKVLSRVKNAKEHGDESYLGLHGPSVSIPLKSFIGEKNNEKDVDLGF